MLFNDRADAGRRLARRLRHLGGRGVVVLGLPRGGVPVAFEVAEELRAPLDVIVVRKLGVSFQPEYAFGAIGENGVRVIDEHVTQQTGLTDAEISAVEARERAELDRRVGRLRGGRVPVSLAGRTVVIVDDGIATGATTRAACQVARARGAGRVVLAVPVGPAESVESLRQVADEVVCAYTPAGFFAIGEWYADFAQATDQQVTALLAKAAGAGPGHAAGDPAEVVISLANVQLAGTLTVPDQATGLVVFAHGSGSSRHSPRNQFVAAALNRTGFGTLLADLLTSEEELDRGCVFNIPLLAGRLAGITGWLRGVPATGKLAVGYFGASTGAAAALQAAADHRQRIAAVVSRGGRPDLAADRLADVRAPTLLIVGGADRLVLDLNRQALERLTCESELAIVPGATHLFAEPGALEQVADLAADWFSTHFAGGAGPTLRGRHPPTSSYRWPRRPDSQRTRCARSRGA
jgi:putative phosphoribosyl transferase